MPFRHAMIPGIDTAVLISPGLLLAGCCVWDLLRSGDDRVRYAFTSGGRGLADGSDAGRRRCVFRGFDGWTVVLYGVPESLHPGCLSVRVERRGVPGRQNANDRFQLRPPRQTPVPAKHRSDRLVADSAAEVASHDRLGDLAGRRLSGTSVELVQRPDQITVR